MKKSQHKKRLSTMIVFAMVLQLALLNFGVYAQEANPPQIESVLIEEGNSPASGELPPESKVLEEHVGVEAESEPVRQELTLPDPTETRAEPVTQEEGSHPESDSDQTEQKQPDQGEQPTEPVDAVEPEETVAELYQRNYDDGNIEGWTVATGAAEFTADQGAVKAVTNGAAILADVNSPAFENGEYQVKLKFAEKPARFGLVVRFADAQNYSVIQYDTNGWGFDYLVDGEEKYGNITSSNSVAFEAGKEYIFKLQFIDDQFKMWIDGERTFSTSLPEMPKVAGNIGLRSWYDDKQIWIDDVQFKKMSPQVIAPEPVLQTDTIQTEDLLVIVDQLFPRVKEYVWKPGTPEEAKMSGQALGVKQISINGDAYVPTLTSYTFENNKAVYKLHVEDENEGIDVNVEVELSAENNVLYLKINQIEQLGATKVATIGFPNHDLVIVKSSEPKAEQAAAWVTGEWNQVYEEFNNLKEGAKDGGGGRTYAFVNNNKLAATIVNNVVNGNDKVRVSIATGSDGEKQASIWNGEWTYQESSIVNAEPLPWAKIIITGDMNGDNTLDWQDGAIAYRNHAEAPQGHEMIRDHISYISMNIGSTTTMPFLRAFDNAKKMSNLTDGFGQLILFKGYQGEGHDDSHPDYGGHIGIRQGGVKDFNYVLSEGKKYNIKGGVHINATEYMKDAFEYKHENMLQPDRKGWGWLDQSFYVDQRKDIESGELKRRLDMLKQDTGDNLSFVYVDVYTGVDWEAKKLAEYINDNGWMLGTEFAGPLHEQAAWIHWGTDPGYPNEGNGSEIIRFIRNDAMDGFLAHPLLKGNQQVGVGYWQNKPELYSYHRLSESFFNHNLPTKYMQYFPIMKWTEDRIDFEGNVYVERRSDGKIYLVKDNHEIAVMTDSSAITDSKVFIPWDPVKEDKVYHWNPAGGESTWHVPESWSHVTTAKLYQLTDLGRTFVTDVPIENGQVTIQAEKGAGYVLYKQDVPEQQEMEWGAGSAVKDPGFDSQHFNIWNKSSAAGSTDHIQIVKNNNADDLLQVSGPHDAVIEQEITGLTPGKTYSASIWVSIDGERKVSMKVEQDGANEAVNWMEDTKHPFYAQQHKYLNTPFQRLEVTFDAKSDTATLSLHVEEGDAKVTFDDARVWENPGKTDQGNSVFFEDFENVDEGWGPFVYSKQGPVRTHLVESNGAQYFSYVMDGKFSLKTNEESPGDWLRTLPQTLRLEPNKRYRLKMDYNAEVADMYTVSMRVAENGQVRDLAAKTLPQGKGKLDLVFQTDHAKNPYLEITKNFTDPKAELTGTLVMDNIRIDIVEDDSGNEGNTVSEGTTGNEGNSGNGNNSNTDNTGNTGSTGSSSNSGSSTSATAKPETNPVSEPKTEPESESKSESEIKPEAKPDSKPQPEFKDVKSHWASEAIQKAQQLGIVSGYKDGTFRPQKEVTRAEFATMLVKALGFDAGEYSALQFKDTDKIPEWAKANIAILIEKGIISGYGDNTFRADQPISRTEMVMMIVRAMGLDTEDKETTSFKDDKQIPVWAKGAIAAAAEKGIVQGQAGHKFAPDSSTTRAEAVKVILNMLEVLEQ